MKNVLAIPGSLRRCSYNRLLLSAAADQAPPGMHIHLFENLGSIPLFDEDLEARNPASVAALRAGVAAADGLLIGTPEYNWSIPGVLKNTIDWLSRVTDIEPLAGKPVAIIGASSGRWGTRLAQAHLRQVLTATESLVLPAPALFIRNAAEAFDQDGQLSDRAVQKQLARLLAAFARWMEVLKGGADV